MPTATLKEATEKLGISLDDFVNYHKEDDKGIIEFDFKKKKQNKEKELNIFDNILNMSEDVGVNDWSKNHDHYLYGTPKCEEKTNE